MSNFEHLNARPLRVSITGIDGAGKDTVTRQALMDVSNEENLTVVKLGRPAYRIDSGESTQIFSRTTESIDRVHQLVDRAKNKQLIVAANALNVVVQSRILEQQVLKDPRVDILASSRDPRVDPVVYFDYYGSGLEKIVSKGRRGRVIQNLTRVSRDLIILLEVAPELAVERINARIAEEAEQDGAGVMREKWRHLHENVRDLSTLAKGYDEALNAIESLGDTKVVRIQTDDLTRDEVVQIAKDAIVDAYDTKHPTTTAEEYDNA